MFKKIKNDFKTPKIINFLCSEKKMVLRENCTLVLTVIDCMYLFEKC